MLFPSRGAGGSVTFADVSLKLFALSYAQRPSDQMRGFLLPALSHSAAHLSVIIPSVCERPEAQAVERPRQRSTCATCAVDADTR